MSASEYFSTLRKDPKLTEEQRIFLDRLSDVIDAVKPAHLALDNLSANFDIGSKRKPALQLELPHVSDRDLKLLLTVEPGAIVVSYGWFDHIHFGYPEPDRPLDEALPFIRDLLAGNVEVEIAHGWLSTRVTTFQISPMGERVELQTCGTLAIFAGGMKWPPKPREVRRLSFAEL
ncbi:MAG: hypothetical protein M3Z11_02420 [Candidatus Dormibacteraeota bacterium]|nr:hypothetical protein [Candidatus Dormibacteraeota bacterium]